MTCNPNQDPFGVFFDCNEPNEPLSQSGLARCQPSTRILGSHPVTGPEREPRSLTVRNIYGVFKPKPAQPGPERAEEDRFLTLNSTISTLLPTHRRSPRI